MKIKTIRTALICLTLFVGLGALWGGGCMLFDPSGALFGFDGLLPGLRKLPFAETLFADLAFSGIALIAVNGLCQLAAAWLLIRKNPLGARAGAVCGALLMLWICIQFFIFPLNWLSVSYFILGLAELALGIALDRRAE